VIFGPVPIIAILRGVAPAEAPDIAAALYAAGLRCVEVTLNSPEPLASIAAIRARFGADMRVGAGTVLSAHEVIEAAGAGAQLIVSPNTDLAVIAATKQAGLISLPGMFTPSEAFEALAAGADALKLFPAEASSPPSLKALLAVLPPGTAVLPVGGIEARSMAAWRAAGATGFGVGGALYKAGFGPDEVHSRALAFVEALSG
jgi:2-dehydro-3-deoxyphosphogalactonate aldolase